MKLKKILLASAIVASLAGIMATSSFAAEAKMTATWDADSKSVIIENCPTAAARKTLLVLTTNKDGSQLTNVAEENIKQIDEQADAYTKVPVGDLADGTYEVRVGGDGTIAYAMFTVGTSGSKYYDDGTVLLGDANGNGEIAVDDATIALRYTTGVKNISKNALQSIDTNDNGEVAVDDATIILRYTTGDKSVLGTKTISQKSNFVPVE